MEGGPPQPPDFESARTAADRSELPPSDPPDERRVLLSFAAVLVGFKLVGLGIIVASVLQTGVGDVVAFLAVTHLPFMAAALGLLYLPLSTLYRRLRLRARRRRLIWAEWHVEGAPSSSTGA